MSVLLPKCLASHIGLIYHPWFTMPTSNNRNFARNMSFHHINYKFNNKTRSEYAKTNVRSEKSYKYVTRTVPGVPSVSTINVSTLYLCSFNAYSLTNIHIYIAHRKPNLLHVHIKFRIPVRKIDVGRVKAPHVDRLQNWNKNIIKKKRDTRRRGERTCDDVRVLGDWYDLMWCSAVNLTGAINTGCT